jgi:carboxyl-terminal processing protease
MIIQRSPLSVRRAVLGAGLLLLLTPRWAAAEPTPGANDPILAELICAVLEQGHVTRPTIGDEVSRRLFRRFLEDLDPGKVYFLKSDIAEFKKHETDLDDMLHHGDVSFAYKVYGRFRRRVQQRLRLIDELTDRPQDFTVKEYLETDPKKLEYLDEGDALRDRWRRRIKFDLLLQRSGAKPLPEAEARHKVHDRYHGLAKRLQQLDHYDLLEIYLSALAASLDPHGAYMSPNTLEDFEIALRLRVEGIGALLREENGYTVVVETVPGGAAARDGRLKPNDKIIAVAQGDGKFIDVLDMRLRDTVKHIRGAKGTRVELKVLPAGKLEPVVYELTRERIEIKSQAARADLVEDGKKPDGKPYRVGVIQLPSFYAAGDGQENGAVQSASADLRRLLAELKAAGVDGVVLDLRNNPGGLLSEAVAVTGLFIDEGPVVQVKDPRNGVRRLNDPERGVAYGGPLVVLVSRHSSSAAEIVAGALQDYGRALIVGDTATHGKGTVQAVVDLGAQLPGNPKRKVGALRLTFQQFYRVNGDSTQSKGVQSDIVLPSLSEYLATPEKEMDYALPFDAIPPVQHARANMVSSALIAKLKARSAERIKASNDFAKLARDIERARTLKELKKMPLAETEFKQQMTPDEAEKADKGGANRKGDQSKEKYQFERNFYNNEVLKILEDFLQLRQGVPGQGRLHRQPAFFRRERALAA